MNPVRIELPRLVLGNLCKTVPLSAVEQYAQEHPTNACLDFIEWEVQS